MKMDVTDIVRKLIGPTDPVGETYADSRRLENLQAKLFLIDDLLGDVKDAREEKDSHMHSMAEIGKLADEYCREWAEQLSQR